MTMEPRKPDLFLFFEIFYQIRQYSEVFGVSAAFNLNIVVGTPISESDAYSNLFRK